MANIIHSLYNFHYLDDCSRKNTPVHRLHPLSKLITTIVYLVTVVSFGKYEILGLVPFLFFPFLVMAAGDIPALSVLKRLLYFEPFIIGIGILNPLFDTTIVTFAGFHVPGGWIVFASLIIKSSLTVTASLLLVATTGMEQIAHALRILKVPKIFVLQILLTYRYIHVLMEEVARVLNAYALKAFDRKGILKKAWGSLPGQILLRTIDRAQRIYDAMCMRGFTGEFRVPGDIGLKWGDILFFACFAAFFIFARIINIPEMIGALLARFTL